MDTDLSLIEISREDDSLLQQMPNDDASCSVYSSSFSPLCTLRPPKPSTRHLGFAVMEESERPRSSTCEENADKENANSIKPEMPKICIEPQQMKRKKKGVGYNLRKSLAWDKAFFTEEGVLDPVELSMISGNLNSLAGEKLSAIHEDGGESISEVPEQRNDVTNLPSCEEKLFKKLPVKATSGSKRAVAYSPQKHNGLAKTGSITSTTNSGLANSIVKNSIPGGHLRRSQLARPENNSRVQSSLSSRKAVASSAFPRHSGKSSTAKSTLPQAKRNVSKVATKQSSSIHVKAASERLQDQVNGPVHHVPSGDRGYSSKMEVPLLQTSENLDTQLPNVPIQTAKPSGLRMPSPSIRFFDQQPKSATSQNSVKNYIHPKNIPQLASAPSRIPYSVKILQDKRTPVVHDRPQHLVSNSPSGNSSMAFPALTDFSTSSHEKLEFYSMRETESRLYNCPTDGNSNIGQTMQNSSDGGGQDIEILEPCEANKQLSWDERNLKLDEDKSLLSLGSCGQKIKDGDKQLIDILGESRDADRRDHTQANTHGGIVLHNGDISMANAEETFMLSSEIDISFSDQPHSANASFNDISTLANQNKATGEPHKCVCAEKVGFISENKVDIMCKSDGSQVQDYSVGLKVGMEKSDVEDAANSVHDDSLTISGPVEDNKLVGNSKDVAGNYIEETDSLACQNMDHSLSSKREYLIESQDSYTDLHLRNDARLCDNTNDSNKELPIVVNDYQSKIATTEAGFVNLPASLPGAIFSTWKLEADHSMYVPASALEDENHPQIGNLIEHKDVEQNQFHPLVQKIFQVVSLPTFGANGQCSNETLTGNFKGVPGPDNKNMPIIQPQIIGSDTRDTNNYQTLVEDEHTDLAGGELDDANDMGQKMNFVQESTSHNSFFSNCTAKCELVIASDLVEQLGDHPDLQDCSVSNDIPIDKEQPLHNDNSFHESHVKCFDNNGRNSELAANIMLGGAEPDLHGNPDIVNRKTEQHGAQNILSDVMINDGIGSHLSTQLEVGESPRLIDEKIIESPIVDHDKETHPLTEVIHLESSSSYEEADPTLEDYNFNVQLQHHSESTSHPTTLSEGTLPPQERCNDNYKPNGLLIKPPTYAPPFSDEWLAAIEAAGEEILTLKSGAVQHSPPDKTAPEPGPWSPVKKRHNQEIGPFDCTKFTNTNTNVPHSSSQ
ncbi:hypothetical protein SAY87_005502 [Trapa incisa]|uniref:Uncharacterized protein n=1 Tax=Trapa incisa TaxID=236973 RepID=A0AAN7Q7Q6_9MYRT|nr:hypothetical protein SAY87_005502 [Trapa incisa]